MRADGLFANATLPVERLILRTLCGMSPAAQRRLFGPPPMIEGQRLAPDAYTFVRLARLAGTTSFVDGKTVAEARQRVRQAAAAAAERSIPLGQVDELQVDGPESKLPARFYRADGTAGKPGPLLVYFHGGGWVIGDLDTHDSVCRFLAANAGVAVLSVGYRLAPEHPFPAAVEDAFASFLWAVERAEELGVDPGLIAVGGDSAGGNLAAVTSMLARDAGAPAPAMQFLLYPATDTVGGQRSRLLFGSRFMLTRHDLIRCEGHYLRSQEERWDPRASILRAPDLRGMPPAYVATAGFDPLRDEGEAYARRLREAGVRVRLRRQARLIHGFANQTGPCPSSRAAMLEAAAALRSGLMSLAKAAC